MPTTANNINARFLAVIDTKTRAEILANIARHYVITSDEAEAEITGQDAEHILDYLTGTPRLAVRVLMKRHGMA
jgi:hypothetical protein